MTNTRIAPLYPEKFPFLSGGGQMGKLTREKNWDDTVLGNPSSWPQSLRTTLGIVLNSKFPMFLWWGQELVCFYNDAYRPSLGENGKHPGILGMPAKQAWPEIWHIIEPLINQVLAGGEATWSEDQLIPIFRNGELEDVYWTFSYSPVTDESGFVAGVLVTCAETTDKIITLKKLEESKDQLQFAIDAADLGAWDINPHTRRFTANDRLKEWHGFLAGTEFNIQDGLNVVNEADRDRLEKAINHSLEYASGGVLDIEYSITNPHTQQTRIVRAMGRTTFGEDHLATRLNGVLQDVTSQAMAKQKIEENERKLRLSIMQAPLAIGIFRGPDYVVEIINRHALALWQRDEADVLNKPVMEAMPEFVSQGIKELLDGVYQTGTPFSGEEMPVQMMRKGVLETAYITFVYEPVYEIDGRINGVMSIGTDVTQHVLSRKKIADSEEQLRIALEGGELGTFDYYPLTGRLNWSAKTKEFFGLPPDAVVDYDTYLRGLHPQDHESSTALAVKQITPGTDGMYELEYRTIGLEDKKLRWVRSKGKATYNEEGAAVRFTGVTQDITKLKLAEEETLQLIAILEASNEFVALAGKDTRIRYINPAGLKLLGWKGFEGRKMLDCVYPGDRTIAEEIFPIIMANGNHSQEIRLWNENTGEVYWIEWNAVSIKDSVTAEVVAFATVSPDITNRKKTEQALRTTEQRLRSLVESAPFPIAAYTGKDMRIAVVNESVLKAWGKNAGIIGEKYADVLPELKGHGIYEQLDDVFTTGVPFHAFNQYLEFLIDGKMQSYYYNYSFTPLYDENGEIYGVLNTGADVTDLNLATKKMEESEKRFRDTVRQAPVGITILRGKDFMVEMANDAYMALVDRHVDQFINHPLFESLPEAESTVRPLLENVLDTGIPFHGIEYPVPINRYKQQDLSYFNFLYHPLREIDGTISGIIVTVIDVTASVKGKHLLAESEKQFRNMVVHSPVAMAILRGKDFTVEIANETLLKTIWRKTAAEVLGKNLLDVFPDDYRGQKYSTLLQEVYNTGKRYSESEAVVYVPDGDSFAKLFVDFEYAPLFETDNSISGIMLTANNVTDQVVARQSIEESEQRLRYFVESAPFPIGVYTGKEMRIQFVNQAILDVWGKGNDVVGKIYSSVLPELEGSGIYEQLDAVFTTGLPYHAHNQRVDLMINGAMEAHYFNYSFTPVFDVNGKIYGVMNTAAEVTDLIITKQKIEESEKRFRNVANSAPVLIWMSGPDKLRTFFNTAWLKFTGRTVEQEIADGWIAGLHPDDAERCMDIYNAAFVEKKEYYMEYRLRRHDGEYRWISARGVPRFTADNVFEGYIGACMDIHEQVIFQKKLIEDEEKLNIVIRASELGTWEYNPQTDVISYSDRYLEIFGHQQRKLLSHDELVNQLHPDDLPIRAKAFEVAFESGSLQYESRLIWPDKSVHWMEAKGKVFYNDQHKPVKMIGTVRDITENKEQDQQKDFFISMASHELKTPITSIKGYVQLLQSAYQKTEDRLLQSSLAVIERQVVTLTSLIGDLLDVSKIKTGSLVLNRQNFEMTEMIQDVISQMRQINPDYSIRYDVKAPVIVDADKERISQVLINFLTNAIKYSPNSKTITVTNTMDNDNVTVWVEDSGIGINKTDQEKIFERFYRVEGKNEKTFPGFGIGLFIASEIVQRHQGRIGVNSEPGKGSVFYFSIPFRK